MQVCFVHRIKFVVNNQQDLYVHVLEVKLEHFVNMVNKNSEICYKVYPLFLFYLDNPCSLSSSTQCLNGGTCVSTNTDPPVASCLCLQGFSGSYCSITLQNNPCTSNPCQTRGYCALSASNTSYSCICQTNYTGAQCERSKKNFFFRFI